MLTPTDHHHENHADSPALSEAAISQPALDILQNVRRVIRAVDRYSKSLKTGYGLTGPQLNCLGALCDIGPMTQKALSEIVHVGPSTITGIIDRLESAGYVERKRHPDDRRKFLVTPTPAGHDLRSRAPSILQGTLAGNLEELPISEQVVIAQSLATLVEMMEADGVQLAKESARLAAITKPPI